MATPWYATRERFVRALDVAETARADWQIDDALAHGTRAAEALTHRVFYPVVDTRSFDWPNHQYARSWRLWLDDNELVSVTSITNGADGTLLASEYQLDPDTGPPYNAVSIDLGSSAGWSSGADGHQRSIVIAGVYGYRNDTAPAGALAEALDATETAVDVNGACAAAVGVGDLIEVGTERMVVTGRAWLDSGQNTAGALTAQPNDVTVPVADGTAFTAGEMVTVDVERMLVVDVVGNNLSVRRAWRGSVLASHASGADVYAARTLTVERGALGTTAATHLTAAAVSRWVPPPGVDTLCLAEAMATFEQERSAYARTVGSGETERQVALTPLRDARAQAYTMYGRQARLSAI